MSDTPEADRPAKGTPTWFVWPLAVILIYLLSVGPAAKIEDTLDLPRTCPQASGVLEVIYTPITIVVKKCRPAAIAFLWYLNLWGVEAVARGGSAG